jgi:hypothetical protein
MPAGPGVGTRTMPDRTRPHQSDRSVRPSLCASAPQCLRSSVPQNASSMTSTRPAVMETTSKRTSTRERPDAGVSSDSHRAANRLIRRCFAPRTDSAPVPKRSVDRVLTSQKATVFPRRTIRSTSPSRRRQFRSRTSYPLSSYHWAARASPSAPSARRRSGPLPTGPPETDPSSVGAPPVGAPPAAAPPAVAAVPVVRRGRPGAPELTDPSRVAVRCSRRGR